MGVFRLIVATLLGGKDLQFEQMLCRANEVDLRQSISNQELETLKTATLALSIVSCELNICSCGSLAVFIGITLPTRAGSSVYLCASTLCW